MTATAVAATVIAAMLAVALSAGRRPRAGRRLEAVLRHERSSPEVAEPPPGGVVGAGWLRSRGTRLAGALVVFGGAVVALGGVVGVLSGLVGALVVACAPFGAPPGPRLDPDGVPVVLDLVAGCLVAGIGLPAALDAAAAPADEVLAEACRGVARGLRAGLTAEEAWAPWLADPWLEPVARTAVRTSQSGAAAADELRRTASRLRARRRTAAQHRVQRASVWLVVPLGLCFLPAFVLVAVVPLVVGLLPTFH